MGCTRSAPWPQKRVLGVAAGPAVGLLEVPRHRVPRPGGADEGAAAVLEEQQPVAPATHEVALVRGEVEGQQRLAAHAARRAARRVPKRAQALLELGDVGAQLRGVGAGRDDARDGDVAPGGARGARRAVPAATSISKVWPASPPVRRAVKRPTSVA